MKKGILIACMCAAVMTAAALPVSAAQMPEEIIVNRLVVDGKVLVDEPTPLSALSPSARSYAIADLAVSMNPTEGSIASCAGTVNLWRSGCRAEAVLSVERSKDDENWTTKKTKSFTATEVGVTGTDTIYAMSRGYYYRATLEVDTYDENGRYRDTLSLSSRSLHN